LKERLGNHPAPSASSPSLPAPPLGMPRREQKKNLPLLKIKEKTEHFTIKKKSLTNVEKLTIKFPK
jgi:hypothetical protein